MNEISSYILPLVVLIVIGYGVKKKLNVYDLFIEGAKESFEMTLNLFPGLLAMILGINLFLNSNVLNYLFNYIGPFLNFLKIPSQILPLALMRPLSGSASLAILNNIFELYGPDGFIGMLASVIQGSTDTTFYVLTLYFGSIGIKKIRYALWSGLLSDLVGIIISIILVNIIF